MPTEFSLFFSPMISPSLKYEESSTICWRKNAFSSEVQLTKLEYVVDLEDASFHVWVSEMDVLIKRG